MNIGPAGDDAGWAYLVDPALFRRENVRRVLAALDIGTLYKILGAEAGLTQRQIAARTGQSQSEVSEIVAGIPMTRSSVFRWGSSSSRGFSPVRRVLR